MYEVATISGELKKYCNWSALPRELLLANQTHTGPTGSEEELLQAFFKHLAASIPQEWAVVQHAVFQGSNGSSSMQPVMHAKAVGSPEGIMAFGGLQVGKLESVKVENEVSWVKDSQAWGLQPDYSRVFQSAPSQPSRQVLKLEPTHSSRSKAAWSAQPSSPFLPVGLLGHSVAVWGSRAFIFGGMPAGNTQAAQDAAAATAGQTASKRPTNKLMAYALDESGTQGGMLPVLSDSVPQSGEVPNSRMYHSAAVDAEGGVMYVYGGITVRERDGARLPADTEAGVVHAFDLYRYSWTKLSTTGEKKPNSTTLLAFFWHQGHLWAIPDLPAAGAAAVGGYQLLRLDVHTKKWHLVETQGGAPSHRTDSCSVFHPLNQELLVYGGRTARVPYRMLLDLHVLQLWQQPPTWQQVQPKLLSDGGSSSSSGGSSGSQQQSLLPLAGHAGGVASSTGDVAFIGGYRRHDVKEPQSLLQVLTKSIKPPTPDAARLGRQADQQQLALQHVRLHLARLVRQHHPNQVLLKPDNGGGVKLPARLLALYSCLFDDLFQGMLQADEDDDGDDGTDQHKQQQQQVPEVPVPGATLDSIAAVCRWMMGLLALGSCNVDSLVEMYRVADRLVMEQLMVEVLEHLGDMQLQPHQAAVVMQLADDLPSVGDAVGDRAAQQLRQQVTPATAPGIMAVALRHNNKQLQAHCTEVMQSHRKNDVWAVLDFALRFKLASLQGSCLYYLRQISRDRMVDRAERIVQMASRRAGPGQLVGSVPVVHMLERDLVYELEEAGIGSLCTYAAASQKLHLQRLQSGLVDHCSTPDVWASLQDKANAHVLKQLQQRYPEVYSAIEKQVRDVGRASKAAAGGGGVTNRKASSNIASGVTNLL